MRIHASSFLLLRRFLGCFGCVVVLWLFGSQAVAAEAAKAGAGTTPQIVRLKVFPESLELGSLDRQHGLLVTAILQDGSEVDISDICGFTSNRPEIADVSKTGGIEAKADGEAEITVRFVSRRATVKVRTAGTGAAVVPSFRQDVLPVLTKTGCNTGGCHGKLAGQNGFKLSLRGYAPEWDHDWLATDARGRRLDLAFPEKSLLVTKPTGETPHEGGRRMEPGSRYQKTLIAWVAARAPGPDTNEVEAARLEVLPGSRTLRPGDTQRLLVRAMHPDGRVRDVTWLAQFFSNDEATLGVSPDGLVTALRAGEATVRVHFQGLVEVARFTVPYSHTVAPENFTRWNNDVDRHVFAKLQALRLPPSEGCDDTTFLRRAFLDVTGTLPSPGDVAGFAADSSPDKRARVVDRLLASGDYADYWTLQFADLLQNRRERDHDVRGAKGVRSFHTWLRSQVAANRPWNELAKDVLLASGDVRERPQIGYYITTMGEFERVQESELADSVAQSFLGTRIGCAKCHNHPLERYTQDDYYHFTAFFSKVALKREDPDKGLTVLSLASVEEKDLKKRLRETEKQLKDAEGALAKAGDNAKDKSAAEKKLTEKQKEMAGLHKQIAEASSKMPGITQPRTRQKMAPQPLDRRSTEIAPGQDPRELLVAWMTDPKNEAFSGAMVNRLWRHYMGVGLVEPVDDLRASNPPSNGDLWKLLNTEFVRSGYDVKHVMRLILNSRAYQLASTTRPENEADRRFYSHFYARRLPAEVMLDAVSQATAVPDQFDGHPVGLRAAQLPDSNVNSYFLTLFGRSDRVTACACERKGEVTLPQLLHLRNGDELTRKVRSTEGRLAGLLKETDDAKVLQGLFAATFGRPPSGTEVEAVTRQLAGGDGRDVVFQDLFWALLNSKEFTFNH